MKKRIIELPDWARIGTFVMVKDTKCIRGDNPHEWYREKIIGFSETGVFHQASDCPVYHSAFTEYGKTIKKGR